MKLNKGIYFFPLLIIFFVFYNLSNKPFHAWDESRHGVNAIEMLNNGDYINLHYAGQKDDWNLKPPLAIWAITLSFKIFGVNEFALRLPSALAILLAFFFLYKIIRLYRSEEFAMFTCLILATVQGWIGFHVGRTGDTDAMLILFLMMSIFYYLKYLDFDYQKGILISGVLLGFAFLIKGPTMLIFLPGMILYPFFTKKIKNLFRRKAIYFAALLFLIFPVGWFFLVQLYGIPFPEKEGLGDNAFDSLFIYDILERFTTPDFEGHDDPRTNSFFFNYLDARFNIWNYFFYVGILFSIFYFIKFKKSVSKYLIQNPILIISLVFALPLCLFMTFAFTQRHWYLAPALPFVAIITYAWIDWARKKHPYFKYVFFIILVYACFNKIKDLNKTSTKPKFISENCKMISNAQKLFFRTTFPDQNLMLYLYSCNQNIVFIPRLDNLEKMGKEDLLFIRKEDFEKSNQKSNFQNITVTKDSEFLILKNK